VCREGSAREFQQIGLRDACRILIRPVLNQQERDC
jgi:hypothetical protein